MDLGGSGRVTYQPMFGRYRSRPTVLRVVFYPYCLLAAGKEGMKRDSQMGFGMGWIDTQHDAHADGYAAHGKL